jgi:CRP-like cAMP-binding protein
LPILTRTKILTSKTVAAYQQFYDLLLQLTPIPNSELQKLPSIFRLQAYPKDAYFQLAGEIPRSLGFMVDGLMRFFFLDEAGNDFTKSFCARNEFTGVYGALLQNIPSHLYVQALEDSLVLVAEFEQFSRLLESHVCWQIVGRKLVEALFIRKERRESELLLCDASTRYQNFLHEYPGLENRLKQYHVASYLGISPVSLSRIRAKLSRASKRNSS